MQRLPEEQGRHDEVRRKEVQGLWGSDEAPGLQQGSLDSDIIRYVQEIAAGTDILDQQAKVETSISDDEKGDFEIPLRSSLFHLCDPIDVLVEM